VNTFSLAKLPVPNVDVCINKLVLGVLNPTKDSSVAVVVDAVVPPLIDPPAQANPVQFL
jgi:hypothetical protein